MLIVFGAIAGLIGFLPLYICFRSSKNVKKNSKYSNAFLMLVGVFDSMVVLVISVLICYFVARDDLAIFVFATAISLIVSALLFGIIMTIRRSNAEKKRVNVNKKVK